jgi:hypothetical protein
MTLEVAATRGSFAQADCVGHGTLTAWHAGCRCPWCESKCRERGCLCLPCVALRAKSPYVELSIDPPSPDRRCGAHDDDPQRRPVPLASRRKELP